MTIHSAPRVMRVVPAALTVSLFAPCAFASPAHAQSMLPPQAEVKEAVRSITPADLAWRVGVMAHDSMQGRDTPSAGLDQTADWIASEFRRLGLQGGGDDGGFLQKYPLRSVALDLERSSFSAGSVRLRFGTDLVPLFGTDEGDAVGGLVLVSGTGRVSGGVQRAVRGNHVALVLAAEATGVDRDVFQLLGALRNAGALSVMVTNPVGDARWEAGARRSLRPSVSKGWGAAGGSSASFAPFAEIRASSLARMLEGTGIDLAELQARAGASLRSQVVDDFQGTLIQRTATEPVVAPNVVGILEGSDPELADEFVVFSAHMDHVGVGTPDENGDSIFNGADDDASGTAAVMEVAQAMVSLPTAPRRSTIFLVVSGEEKGLWGSEWFSEHPSAPVEQLVANLNTDMVGRNWTDTIVAIGKEHSDLGQTLNRVNAEHPELRMTAIDDLWPEERFYFRSDHYNFARKGVPVLFFFNGTHEDYHGRDDEADRIDAEKAARIAKLVFYLGLDLANADERPRWDPASYARIVSDG